MLTLFFNPQPVTDWPSAAARTPPATATIFWELIDRGVYMPCSQYEALFVSAAHTPIEIETTIEAAREALATSGRL